MSPAFRTDGLARMASTLGGHVERGEVAGVVTLLARGGDVHVDTIGLRDRDSGAPMTRDTIFRVASNTKPIVAVAAMILVEEGVLRLDESVERLLPELSNRRVLRSLDAPLDDTVAATRPITVRDLLTSRAGYGAVMAAPGRHPIQRAMSAAELTPGHDRVAVPPDEFMRRLASIPLASQPGERWMYQTASDILGVLVARAAKTTLGAFLRERIFAPLGMNDTAFSTADVDRLATCYRVADGLLDVFDPARGGGWSRPPPFEGGSNGLVSTADDLLAFHTMLLHHGESNGRHIVSRTTVDSMTTDQIPAEQKAASPFFPGFWDDYGWGLGMAVVTRRDPFGRAPGSFGWDGGFCTSAYVDPQNDFIAILLAQRAQGGADPVYDDFWKLAYEALAP